MDWGIFGGHFDCVRLGLVARWAGCFVTDTRELYYASIPFRAPNKKGYLASPAFQGLGLMSSFAQRDVDLRR